MLEEMEKVALVSLQREQVEWALLVEHQIRERPNLDHQREAGQMEQPEPQVSEPLALALELALQAQPV